MRIGDTTARDCGGEKEHRRQEKAAAVSWMLCRAQWAGRWCEPAPALAPGGELRQPQPGRSSQGPSREMAVPSIQRSGIAWVLEQSPAGYTYSIKFMNV
ncbi:hypothetical protein NDU88_000043 [Pleurodeles waltl]|uniref:Uncharacterized protein n=1 Tax=Pleurodeles waltl TaxID=8319 RepID=A0AAV7VTG4_PLEWA|nr:hypothetical protein NDU88_000043 [Pleurodeles waltl]